MRDKNIGNLYPGATAEYEEEMKRSLDTAGFQDMQQLYSVAKFQQMNANRQLQQSRWLLEFIEEQGHTAKELVRFLRKKQEALNADELEDQPQIEGNKNIAESFINKHGKEIIIKGNNLQTQGLEDDNNTRR